MPGLALILAEHDTMCKISLYSSSSTCSTAAEQQQQQQQRQMM